MSNDARSTRMSATSSKTISKQKEKVRDVPTSKRLPDFRHSTITVWSFSASRLFLAASRDLCTLLLSKIIDKLGEKQAVQGVVRQNLCGNFSLSVRTEAGTKEIIYFFISFIYRVETLVTVNKNDGFWRLPLSHKSPGRCLKDRAEIVNLRKDYILSVPLSSVDKIKSTAKWRCKLDYH